MNKIEHLSYSALRLREENPRAFVMQKVLGFRQPPQQTTRAQIGGLALDAFIKQRLEYSHAVLGFDREALSRVGPAYRDEWATAQLALCHPYLTSRAWADVRDLLDAGYIVDARTDRTVTRVVGGVPIKGILDFDFSLDHSGGGYKTRFVLDWKVKGYGSKSGASPTPGYYDCNHGGPHDSFRQAESFFGIPFSANVCEPYHDQLATYHWLLGAERGQYSPCLIHEIIVRPTSTRVAAHAWRVEPYRERLLLGRYQRAWDEIQRGQFVPWLDVDENERYLDDLLESLAQEEALA
jgi:hypothetical protein